MNILETLKANTCNKTGIFLTLCSSESSVCKHLRLTSALCLEIINGHNRGADRPEGRGTTITQKQGQVTALDCERVLTIAGNPSSQFNYGLFKTVS